MDDYDVTPAAQKLGEAEAVLAALFSEELGTVIRSAAPNARSVMAAALRETRCRM